MKGSGFKEFSTLNSTVLPLRFDDQELAFCAATNADVLIVRGYWVKLFGVKNISTDILDL